MRFSEIAIETHRENPANARSQGAAWLVRAGYVSHGGALLPLGRRVMGRVDALAADPCFFDRLGLHVLVGPEETYFPLPSGPAEILHCPACGYVHRSGLAQARKEAAVKEALRQREKVATPDCPGIASLAQFLKVAESRTAKSLMFVRETDSRFLFALVRGDMTLSEGKLAACVGGEVRMATEAEIRAVGAVPGYASPVGIANVLVAVDDLIAQSSNLVAGANEPGFHLVNVNPGRDYQPDLVADLTLASAGDPCRACGGCMEWKKALVLSPGQVPGATFDSESILYALAETHHDDKGLRFPAGVAPFDVYLMQVPSKALDTRSAAEALDTGLMEGGVSVLFDDREERAGVKFNDADLIGCPVRLTVGDRGLRNGVVEWKERGAAENQLVPMDQVLAKLRERR